MGKRTVKGGEKELLKPLKGDQLTTFWARYLSPSKGLSNWLEQPALKGLRQLLSGRNVTKRPKNRGYFKRKKGRLFPLEGNR